MEDPEAAFIKGTKKPYNNGFSIHTADVLEPPLAYRSSRISGDVSMESSNASADGTLQLRQVRVYWCFLHPSFCDVAILGCRPSSTHGVIRRRFVIDGQQCGQSCKVRRVAMTANRETRFVAKILYAVPHPNSSCYSSVCSLFVFFVGVAGATRRC